MKKRMTSPNLSKVIGEMGARIIELSCSEPPAGKSRFFLRILADQAVELNYIENLSYDTVGKN